MQKKLCFFILTIFIFSCNGFGPVDRNIQTKNLSISKEELIGKWKMDSFSYRYLSNLKNDSIEIEFYPDSTFKMNNSSKLFKNSIDNEITVGKWKIDSSYKTKSIQLNFNSDKTNKQLEIYKKGKEYQLWYFLNDPDSGERIRFLR